MIQIVSAARNYDVQDRSPVSYTANLFYCTKCRAETASSFFVNTAGSYCLYYMLSGEISLCGEVGRKGDMILFPKLSNVSVRIGEGSEWLCVMFDYSHELSMLYKREYRLIHCTSQMREMVESLYSSTAYRSTMPGAREAMLLVILNEAGRTTLSESKSITLYEEACEWIEKNAVRSISVEDVAAAVGCTREHLNRVFRMASGKSVGTWIARARVWEIEQLCRVSELSLADIAKRLDFPSVELLCKFFRYHKGVALSQYRLTQI